MSFAAEAAIANRRASELAHRRQSELVWRSSDLETRDSAVEPRGSTVEPECSDVRGAFAQSLSERLACARMGDAAIAPWTPDDANRPLRILCIDGGGIMGANHGLQKVVNLESLLICESCPATRLASELPGHSC